jgi:hypothetical protein
VLAPDSRPVCGCCLPATTRVLVTDCSSPCSVTNTSILVFAIFQHRRATHAPGMSP